MTAKKKHSFILKILGCALLPIVTLIVVLHLNSVPNFSTVDGDEHRWKSDKWMLVNYFAQWCKPCLEELPELNKLSNNAEIRLFGVSYDELTDEKMIEVINKYGIRFPVIKTKFVAFLPISKPSVLPTSYLISPQGEVVEAIYGKVTQESILMVLRKHQNTL